MKNSYFRNFLIACYSGIGFLIILLAFGLNMFQSFLHFLTWFVILTDFILFIISLKLLFRWININDVIDGVWAGIVLYCWSPILTLPWTINFVDALKNSTFYMIIGLAILLFGYKLRKKKE